MLYVPLGLPLNFTQWSHYQHLMQNESNDETELTLFRLPGPVLIIVYKLSPELFESKNKVVTRIISTG